MPGADRRSCGMCAVVLDVSTGGRGGVRGYGFAVYRYERLRELPLLSYRVWRDVTHACWDSGAPGHGVRRVLRAALWSFRWADHRHVEHRVRRSIVGMLRRADLVVLASERRLGEALRFVVGSVKGLCRSMAIVSDRGREEARCSERLRSVASRAGLHADLHQRYTPVLAAADYVSRIAQYLAEKRVAPYVTDKLYERAYARLHKVLNMQIYEFL